MGWATSCWRPPTRGDGGHSVYGFMMKRTQAGSAAAGLLPRRGGLQLLDGDAGGRHQPLRHHDLLLQRGRLRHDLVLDLDPGLPARLPGPPHPLHPAGHRPGQLRSARAHWYCGQEGKHCLNVFPSRIYLCQCFLWVHKINFLYTFWCRENEMFNL